MSQRRILSLWFPRLAAERLLRDAPELAETPLAIVAETGNTQTVASLSALASAKGVRRGMSVADARALCPGLMARAALPHREAMFLASLRRWAGRYSPWVATEGREALALDITGCAHLFGGEEALAARIDADCDMFRLTHRIGIADTPGAAWAVARYAGQPGLADRSGDAIDQEARATRSRASKRGKWQRVEVLPGDISAPRIAPPGRTRQVLATLPVAALRLPAGAIATLERLGLRTIGDMANMPRAALARRIGMDALRRLDQALGAEPEPISPVRAETHFAMRLSLPEPIGLEADLIAAVDRLLPPLCDKLRKAGRGARRLALTCMRADATHQSFDLGLARPSWDTDHMRPLILLKLRDVDAGYGIDVIRLEASATEPMNATQHKGHLEAATEAKARSDPAGGAAFDILLSRLGARLGLESLTRLAPSESNIPEKTANVMAAAYSDPVDQWPLPRAARPLILFAPEPALPLDDQRPPARFRWRRRILHRMGARGPERIAPEWWLDDPAWRSGPRDYWQVELATGERLWLFEVRGSNATGGWFVHGDFG